MMQSPHHNNSNDATRPCDSAIRPGKKRYELPKIVRRFETFPHTAVVMPNHVHGIIIAGSLGAGSEPAPTKPDELDRDAFLYG